MKTPGIIIAVGIVLGLVLLLVQNPTPALPLAFLGFQTGSYPLAVWLLGALACGALTTLGLVRLLPSHSSPNRKYRPKAYRRVDAPGTVPPRRSQKSPKDPIQTDIPPSRRASAKAAPMGSRKQPSDHTWEAWSNLQSPTQWADWEHGDRSPGSAPERSRSSPRPWWRRGQQPDNRVEESLQDLTEGWDDPDIAASSYRPPGASPVQDALEDIGQGWRSESSRESSSFDARSFEVPQSPQRTYQKGTVYSYRYRPDDNNRDDIYGPPDSDEDWDADSEAFSYPEDGFDASARANADEGFADGDEDDEEDVVDADYRVIIPPARPLAEDAEDGFEEDVERAADVPEDWGRRPKTSGDRDGSGGDDEDWL